MPDPINVADYEALAADRLEAGLLGYYQGGAGDERTLRDNVAAWSRYKLRPRVLVDVSEVDASTTILGQPASMPIVVAPTALQRMAHPDGEPGMARAAATAGTIHCLSTLATSRPSEVAENAPKAPRWFQLYAFKDSAVTTALCDEALEHGFDAVVLTVDAPRAGRRERDFRTGFNVPADVDMPSVRAATGAPVCPTPAEFFDLLDRSLTWETLEELSESLPVPLIVKGIQTAEDAELACRHGAGAIVVSNHGGRQLDNVAASLDMLPEVVDAVEGRVEVYVDGGVRRGTDALVALALGARAVLVGRPLLWGLTVGGEEGARKVLEILRDELLLGMTLLGTPTPADVQRTHLG